MTLPYISPKLMETYRQTLILFAKGSSSLECIRSHYYSDRSGSCDLTGAKEQEEIFVLSNRANHTMKVSRSAMQIVANVLDIIGADAWYDHLKTQKKAEKERLEAEAQKREEQKSQSRVVLIKKKPLGRIEKNQSSKN
jgi:hypothetical protein